jgi:hypothetical protein
VRVDPQEEPIQETEEKIKATEKVECEVLVNDTDGSGEIEPTDIVQIDGTAEEVEPTEIEQKDETAEEVQIEDTNEKVDKDEDGEILEGEGIVKNSGLDKKYIEKESEESPIKAEAIDKDADDDLSI